jgi:H+/gluconate symporter-like permease
MAKSGSPNKLIGIALLATGAGLAFWGFQKAEGLQSQLSSAFTGSYTDNVMMLYIAAAVCLAIGAFLLIKK